jgi:hypothetical protein
MPSASNTTKPTGYALQTAGYALHVVSTEPMLLLSSKAVKWITRG